MEALTAVAVAALTIYDMVKAVDKTMVIGDIRLMFKSGGRSGTYTAGRPEGRKARRRIGRKRPSCLAHEHPHRRDQPRPGLGDAAALRRSDPPRLPAAHRSAKPGIARRCARLLPDADAAFTPFVDRDVFPSASRLRWVQSPAVGVGNLMFPELLASPVVITSGRGIRARAIAEHVLGVTIALARQLPVAIRAQIAHRWAQDELEGATVDVRTLQGQRMGIVGLGAIGLELVKIAAPFGFRVSAIRRRAGEPRPDGVEAVWPPDRLPDLLAQSDVVVLAAAAYAGDEAADRETRARPHQARRAAGEHRPR